MSSQTPISLQFQITNMSPNKEFVNRYKKEIKRAFENASKISEEKKLEYISKAENLFCWSFHVIEKNGRLQFYLTGLPETGSRIASPGRFALLSWKKNDCDLITDYYVLCDLMIEWRIFRLQRKFSGSEVAGHLDNINVELDIGMGFSVWSFEEICEEIIEKLEVTA